MKEGRFDFYLAHPVEARKWIREWELEVEKDSGLILLNPFYDVEGEQIYLLDNLPISRSEYAHTLNPHRIVMQDLKFVKASERGTIAFITGDVSYGTIMEIAYSKIMDKEVYTFVSNDMNGHPWLRFHSTKIYTDMRELEREVLGIN